MSLRTVITCLGLSGIQINAQQDSQINLNDVNHHGGRELRGLFKSSQNIRCANECIKLDQHWCIDDDFEDGQCCSNESCTGGLSSPLCSFDTRVNQLKYYTCPQSEGQCGTDRIFIAPRNGEAAMIKPGENYFSEFRKGASCAYMIKFPSDAGPTDTIRFILDESVRISPYVVIGSSFESTSGKATVLNKNDIISVNFPDNLFLIFISDSVSASGYFSMRYKFINNNPTEAEIKAAEAQLAAIPDTERVVVIEERFQEIENEFIGSTNFYFVIGIAGLILVVITITAIYLWRVHKNNQQLLTKIQVLNQSKIVDGKLVSKTEAIQIQTAAKPSSKPTFGDAGDQHDFIQAQVGIILKDSAQQQQFKQMFDDFIKKQQEESTIENKKNMEDNLSDTKTQLFNYKKNAVTHNNEPNNDLASEMQYLPNMNQKSLTPLRQRNTTTVKIAPIFSPTQQETTRKAPNQTARDDLQTEDSVVQSQNNTQTAFLPTINTKKKKTRPSEMNMQQLDILEVENLEDVIEDVL